MTDEDNTVVAPTAVAVLTYVVQQLVDEPDAVRVDTSPSRRHDGVRLDVTVAPGELGRLIGKKGRMAQAIRTVVRAAATRDDVAVDVEFVD